LLEVDQIGQVDRWGDLVAFTIFGGTLFHRLMTRFIGCALVALAAAACGGTPSVSTQHKPTELPDATGEAGAGGQGNADGKGKDKGNDPNPVIVTGDAGSGNGNGCKTTCDAGECGPIADGCGDVINCGGCTAPETCGGGGKPSHCGGVSACKPTTCKDLGATCGEQPDGCGDVLDCWSSAAKANGNKCTGDGEQCIDGDCKVPPTTCTKLTCKDYNSGSGLCGPVSDGCGGTLDCGFACSGAQICGAVEAGKCGTVTCQPQSCETALASQPAGFCGFVPDGCGGEVKNCATECTNGDTCGGGGTPDVCGQGSTQTCTARTTADCGTTCGPISDGCGGTVNCGGCSAPATCGGGGTPGQCGAPACQPRACADFQATCGSIPDGCGATLDCNQNGGCGTNEICNANKCQAVVCQPLSKAQVCTGFCGTQSDGCGGTVDCGGCTAPNTCGGGGTPSVCGAPACKPLTCADVGANCGPIGDGCGGIVSSCGTCSNGEICGGGGTASVCGKTTNNNCTGLCQNQVNCAAGQETRLTGTVYAPNGTQPLYNALVYVPNAPLPAITAGPTCGRCQDEDLGSPIAAAITGADGKFVLKNVPAGVDFPLVVKMGKWRRVVTIPAQTQCTNVNLTVDQARLPRNMNDSSAGNKAYLNIPQMAVVTGSADAMECVLRKIGVSDTEFTLPTSTGRVHLYRANGGYEGCSSYRKGQCQTPVSAPLSDLFTNKAINKYDIGIFDCEGAENEHNGYDPAVHAFANAGGRVFASHYSYTYLHDNGDFANTATWNGPQFGNSNTTTGIIDTGTSKGQSFNAWLGYTNSYSTKYGNGYIDIQDPRYYVKANDPTVSERFVYTDANAKVNGTKIDEISATQEYAFNTPVGANSDNICGRVLYSAFHVAVGNSTSNAIFPAYCSTGPLTAQEKVLEFMLFDLSACVSVGTPTLPTCTPKTCNDLGATCGYRADGCGGLLQCGDCQAPDSCGGGGVPNQCGHSCKQTTCGAKGANCGVIGDGCGGTLNCGDCTAPAICGGGGTANVCGTPACSPRSCASVGATCGPISDGCGSTVDCGACPSGQTCGGGGTPNACGTGSCNPMTCSGQNAECGFIGDGCGGTVSCGTCPSGQTCGAGGPNKCGGACVPRTCGQANANCGFIGDGCGGVLDCGSCMAPQVCGGGGVPSQCGGSCTPRTCAQANAACGAVSDGCGGVLQCGVCPAGQTCGGAGIANQCGAGTCTPKGCSQANAACGAVGDGCGNVLQCGTCPSGQSCGGGGVPNQCGAGGCVPLTCAQQGADCGPAADGCGGLLDCGTCSQGTCGGGGVASKCGSIR
jgi:hypothetical protein